MDNIAYVALNEAIRTASELFLDMYNTCLEEGKLDEKRKCQKLVLLPKDNKPLDDPSSYYYLCKLHTVIECTVHNRIQASIGHALAENRYVFREEKSTIDAINRVLSAAREAIQKYAENGGPTSVTYSQHWMLKTSSIRSGGTIFWINWGSQLILEA